MRTVQPIPAVRPIPTADVTTSIFRRRGRGELPQSHEFMAVRASLNPHGGCIAVGAAVIVAGTVGAGADGGNVLIYNSCRTCVAPIYIAGVAVW